MRTRLRWDMVFVIRPAARRPRRDVANPLRACPSRVTTTTCSSPRYSSDRGQRGSVAWLAAASCWPARPVVELLDGRATCWTCSGAPTGRGAGLALSALSLKSSRTPRARGAPHPRARSAVLRCSISRSSRGSSSPERTRRSWCECIRQCCAPAEPTRRPPDQAASGSALAGAGTASPRARWTAWMTWRWSASEANQSRGNTMARGPSSTTRTGATRFHGTERRRK